MNKLDWDQVLKLGAVDCSNQVNTPICRYYGIVFTPSLKYFPSRLDKQEGTPIPRKVKQRDTNTVISTVHELRNNITLELLRREDLSEIQPFRGSLEELGITRLKPNTKYLVLVAECSPMIGPQLVLDYRSIRDISVVPIDCRNSLLQELGVKGLNLGADNKVLVVDLFNLVNPFRIKKPVMSINFDGKLTRAKALTKLHSYFQRKKKVVPQAFNLSSIKDITDDLKKAFSEINTGKEPYKHTGEVFQVDIEGALSHSLTMEIPVHKLIQGKSFTALKNYLEVLFKYFPIGKDGKQYLKCVLLGVEKKNTGTGITGLEFVDNEEQCRKTHNPKYLEPDNGWVGCHGTFPMFRSFPCSMWVMFHTLTVQAYDKGAKDPQEVLRAIKGYVRNFFGCSDCSNHFSSMASTMEGDVETLTDSVLWLWAAHNKANERLQGDATEDPHFPKRQFPTSDICRPCHKSDGSFDKKEVLNFLVRMYTNINKKVTPTQLEFNTSYVGKRQPQQRLKKYYLVPR